MEDPKCATLTSLTPPVLLPDGSTFSTWEQPCNYERTFHVAANMPGASDSNDGSLEKPWKTIQRAAEKLKPGECVLVHAGTYRETIVPTCGGTGPSKMIGYFAAADAEVIVSGAEIYQGPWEASANWKMPKGTTLPESATIYQVRLPKEWFIGYLPFGMVNMPQHHLDLGWGRGFPEEPRMKLLLKRGLVFQDGRRLLQVLTFGELRHSPGSYWCEANGLTVHIRPFSESEPAKSQWEFSVREQAFAPHGNDVSFLHLRGISFQYCADGFTWPQHAAVSAGGGTHWLIERCTVRQVNANGVDLGSHHPMRHDHGGHGHHIVRGSSFHDCGICGICATAAPLSNMLVEDNHITGAGWHGIERLWESAGIKQHLSKNCLYRRNVIEGCLDATGIWLDNGITNTRVTQNLITNTISGFGAIFIEISKVGRVLVDHNVILGSKMVPPLGAGIGDESITGGHGIYQHDCDRLLVAHNLIVGCEGSAVMLRLGRVERFSGGGRGGVCRGHEVLNNLVIDCKRCVEFGRPENRAEGNLYANPGREGPFRIHDPIENMDFEGWQEFLHQDRQGCLSEAKASYNAETRVLRLDFAGGLPTVESFAWATHDFFAQERALASAAPGPFTFGASSMWEGSVDPR